MTTNGLAGLLFLGLATLAGESHALTCAATPFETQYHDSRHIFLIVIDRAEYAPVSDEQLLSGTVVADFRVVEVLKGDPLRVPHVEFPVAGPDEDWPVYVPLGQQRILLAGQDGPVTWRSCSQGIPAQGCNWYAFLKLAGRHVEADEACDGVILRTRFRHLGVPPEELPDDLQGLRREWRRRFGEWPD